MILAGDIGGTKTNLALYEQSEAGLELQIQWQFASREFDTLIDVIAAFENEVGSGTVEAACFGIAGPVIEGRCRTTNLPWDVTEAALAAHLGGARVRLLNDLEATAYGMLYLEADALKELNPTARQIRANRAVIAAGTGLGEAMLYWDGSRYHPSGSEGGHCDFAPQSPQQDELLRWLRHRHPLHVSIERILSGPGIATLYDFLFESGFASQPPYMLQLAQGSDRSAAISRCALEDHDPLCRETLRLFAEIYGAEAGNLALKTMALGGVYIGGGIAPKIAPFVEAHFLEAFVSKGRFEEMLRAVPIRLSLDDKTALLGAARFAFDQLL